MVSHASLVGVVILAGGASSRMGQPKLLLPWGTTSILGALIEQWTSLGAAQIGIVLSVQAQQLTQELDRLNFPVTSRLFNVAPERGMFSSIQTAAAWKGWAPRLTHWAIVLGDQPHLRTGTLRQLLQEATPDKQSVTQPAWQGKGAHPVIVPRLFWDKIPAANESSLKDFFVAHACPRNRIEMNDPSLALDIDTPEDYRRALIDFGI